MIGLSIMGRVIFLILFKNNYASLSLKATSRLPDALFLMKIREVQFQYTPYVTHLKTQTFGNIFRFYFASSKLPPKITPKNTQEELSVHQNGVLGAECPTRMGSLRQNVPLEWRPWLECPTRMEALVRMSHQNATLGQNVPLEWSPSVECPLEWSPWVQCPTRMESLSRISH